MRPAISFMMAARVARPTTTPLSIFTSGPNENVATKSIDIILNSLPANCLLVVTSAGGNDSTDQPNGTCASVPVLTWTKQVESKANHSGDTEIWTAPFAAGGNITITIGYPNNGTGLSAVAYCVQNAESVLGGASNHEQSQGDMSVAVTTTRANSILFCVSSDWDANNGTPRTIRDGATETAYYFESGGYTHYHYYKQTTSIATYTEGYTVPTGTTGMGTSVYEIRGN